MAVEYKDYYKLLGVERSSAKEDISKAYKKLARKYHPDLNPNNKEAESRFKEINEAYEVLKDDEKRRLYDQLGPNWEHGQHFQSPPGFEGYNFGGPGNMGGGEYHFSSQGFGGFSDFFEMIFGGAGNMGGGPRNTKGAGQHFGNAHFGADPFGAYSGQGGSARGGDAESTLTLSLEEAYRGGNKAITLQSQTGETRNLEVFIPRGVKPGARIRLAGQGQTGFGGGSAGDLYLKVQIAPHELFKLEGNNIVYTLPLAPWEAALGSTVRVPTLDGEVDLNIPAGTGSGRRLRLRDRGLGSGASKGVQYVAVQIQTPEKLSEAEKELWQKLAEISSFKARLD